MATAALKITSELVLTLTMEEAALIKGLVQNPCLAAETAKEAEARQGIWRVLDEANIPYS